MNSETPIKLFSRTSIIVATVLGTLASGLCLMGFNEMRLKRSTAARIYFWSAVLFCVSLFAFLMLVPERIQVVIPYSVHLMWQLGVVMGLYWGLQNQRIQTLLNEKRATFAGVWQAFLFGLSSVIVILACLLVAAYFGAFPPFPGHHFKFGAFEHEIYYDNVTEIEAEEIAVALDELGHFDFFNESIYFQINRVDNRLQITFPYDDEAVLTSKQLQDYFTELKTSLLRDYNIDVDIIILYDGLTDSAFLKV